VTYESALERIEKILAKVNGRIVKSKKFTFCKA
jgi:hypothetical protein